MTKKNVVLFIGNDVIAHMFLNHFVPQMVTNGINPILVTVESDKPTAYNHTELNRYHFYETEVLNDVIAPHFESQELSAKSQSLTQKQLIEKYNLTTIPTNDVNSASLQQTLNSLDFIGAISVRCFQIFKSDIIKNIQSKGFFCNSHPGILPYHKGVFCMMRGIVSNNKHLGWTLHEIDEGIDTGHIIKRLPIRNTNELNPIPLYAQSVESLSDAWVEYINEHLNHGYVESYKQSLTGDYYTYPTETEITNWVSKGQLDLIDTKSMVLFYYNLFMPETAKYTQDAMDYKILLINKISQFETSINTGQNVTQLPGTNAKKIAA